MTLTGWKVSTPIGPLTVVCDGQVVVVSGFGDATELLTQIEGDITWGDPQGAVADAVVRYLNQFNAIDLIRRWSWSQ